MQHVFLLAITCNFVLSYEKKCSLLQNILEITRAVC